MGSSSRSIIRTNSKTGISSRRLNTRRATIGARVMRAFERSIRVQNHRTGVAHRVGSTRQLSRIYSPKVTLQQGIEMALNHRRR